MYRLAPMVLLMVAAFAQHTEPGWKHLSVKNGDLEPPNQGREQTSATVFDIDGDGINDFVVTERTAAPSVVWYRRSPKGWTRYILEPAALTPEAGSTFFDVDGDGDLDFVAGADHQSNQVWWWENPAPNFDPAKGWVRHTIKKSGKPKHHDSMFIDADDDGKQELVFWNQGAQQLMMARIPPNPRVATEWPLSVIYSYSPDSEMLQRGKPPSFKSVNEHEGLGQADIDGDGKLDIVGGGRWFKHLGGDRFQPNFVDASYAFSRSGAGQLKKGGRPEVVLVVGDGEGPLNWYEWVKGTWVPHTLVETINNGHSLLVTDFDSDGNLDIFCAEMNLNRSNPQAKTYIFLGDGAGNFRQTIVSTGFDNHESKLADLDGDGKLDILGKPYNFQTPDLNIWLNRR